MAIGYTPGSVGVPLSLEPWRDSHLGKALDEEDDADAESGDEESLPSWIDPLPVSEEVLTNDQLTFLRGVQ